MQAFWDKEGSSILALVGVSYYEDPRQWTSAPRCRSRGLSDKRRLLAGDAVLDTQVVLTSKAHLVGIPFAILSLIVKP